MNPKGNHTIVIGFFILFCTFSGSAFAQSEHEWWNIKHNWDGVTHWTKYLILSPAYQGPNSLPVPEFYDGNIPDAHQLEFGLEGHYSPGDRTGDLFLAYDFPLFTDRATFQISWRAVEAYATDTITRDLRRSRQLDPKGFSRGDVYASTYIQLLKDHAYLPDIMLSANLKTASGGGLPFARHTDTPGYWFDATFAKAIRTNHNKLQNIRIYGKTGFFAYQTYDDDYHQNDAFLYGAGFAFSFQKIKIHNQFTGYSGYFENGDRPLVYRFILDTSGFAHLNYRFIFQYGIRDFPYTSARISLLWNLS